MDDFDILKELFSKEALGAVSETPYGKKYIVLEEPKKLDNNGYSVTLLNVPDEVIVIKTDHFPAPKKFFQNNKSECKRADYALIARNSDKNKKWIIYIELKLREREISRYIVVR